MANIPGTDLPSTGNQTVDNAIASLQKATDESIQLNLTTTTEITKIQGVSRATQKINPQ